MPFYEIIFETGSHSVAEYENDEKMLEAVKAHHARAKSGAPGGPPGHPAERIARVEKYDKHPDDYNYDQTLSADVMKKELEVAIKSNTEDGVVSIPAVVAEVRDLSNPLVREKEPQTSMYKAEAVEVFTEGWDD